MHVIGIPLMIVFLEISPDSCRIATQEAFYNHQRRLGNVTHIRNVASTTQHRIDGICIREEADTESSIRGCWPYVISLVPESADSGILVENIQLNER